jgi:hypothetical protein
LFSTRAGGSHLHFQQKNSSLRLALTIVRHCLKKMNKNVKKYNYFKKLVAMPLQRCALGTGYHVIEKYLHSEIYLIFLLERHFLENNRKQDYTSFNAKQLRGILLLIHSTNKFIKYSLSPVNCLVPRTYTYQPDNVSAIKEHRNHWGKERYVQKKVTLALNLQL